MGWKEEEGGGVRLVGGTLQIARWIKACRHIPGARCLPNSCRRRRRHSIRGRAMQQDRSLCRCVAGVNTTSGRECEGVGHQNSTLPEPAPLAKAFPVVVATFSRWWESLCVHVRAGVGRGSGVAAVQVCLY